LAQPSKSLRLFGAQYRVKQVASLAVEGSHQIRTVLHVSPSSGVFQHSLILTVPAIFYRFLIKEPVKKKSTNYPNLNDFDSSYTWRKLAFFISWTPQGKIRVLCFDIPFSLQETIYSIIKGPDFQLTLQGPLDINNIMIEETVALFDRSVWSWRDVVRDLEKVYLHHPSNLRQPALTKVRTDR